MAYFNLEDIKKIFSRDQSVLGGKKEQIVRSLRVALFVILAIIVGLIVYFQQRGPGELGEEEGRVASQKKLTDEEKIRILKSLSAPSDAPQYTNEEKRKILESLSAPEDAPRYTDEEKKAILKSLSAPRE